MPLLHCHEKSFVLNGPRLTSLTFVYTRGHRHPKLALTRECMRYGQRSIILSYSSSPHRHKFAYDRQDLGLEALAVPLPLKIELYGVVLVLWFVILEVKVQRPWHLE